MKEILDSKEIFRIMKKIYESNKMNELYFLHGKNIFTAFDDGIINGSQ